MGFDDFINDLNPYVRDLVPGFGAAQDIIGGVASLFGYDEKYAGMPGYQAPTQVSGAGGAAGYNFNTANDFMGTGGATLDWSSMGVPTALALTGARRVYPYTGGLIPSGYRVANRPARRPTSGYPAGTYLVPRRRMNPLNPRALMRAERRMGAFTHWVKRHFRIASASPRRRKASRFGGRKKR